MFNRKFFVFLIVSFVFFEFSITNVYGGPSIARSFSQNTRAFMKCFSFLRRLQTHKSLLGSSSSESHATTSSLPAEELPAICKLHNDCLEACYDYLTLRDLSSIGQTCKQFQQSAGQFFHDNFANRMFGQNGRIHSSNDVEVNCFIQFIQRFQLKDGNLSAYEWNHFQSLKELEFFNGEINSPESVQCVLSELDSLNFIHCELNDDVHETFLKHCEKLKQLSLRDNNSKESQQKIIIGTSNDWLSNEYPILEHFSIDSRQKIDEVVEFLKLNRNIRKFSTSIEFLMENLELFKKSEIKLETLAIFYFYTNMDEALLYANLDELHGRNFFQKLNMFFYNARRIYVHPLNFLAAVTILHMSMQPNRFELSPYINLEQLHLANTSQIIDLNEALDHVTKLSYICIYNETIENILPFVNRLPNLKGIKIDVIRSGSHFDEDYNILDLTALNDERAKLTNPQKLNIYVREGIYLATRYEFGQGKLDFIEMKRSESYDGLRHSI